MKRILGIVASSVLAVSAYAQTASPSGTPVFSLAWSEYPSWSAFDVASTNGIIDGRKGFQGEVEKKHGIDIELKLLDYDPCIQAYASNQVDAVCITNIDILSASMGRKSVAILPTSTSYGGDALIVSNNIASVKDLKGSQVYGLGKSVSEYVFVGILERNGLKASDVTFSSMDPSQVSLALQGKDAKVRNGVVWNPFILDTLKKRTDLKILADSRDIPFEVIDMVVVGDDILSKTKGDSFAKAVCEAYYKLNESLNSKDQSVRDATLIAIGEKFSSLGLADMRKVVQQTHFFDTSAQGVAIFNNENLFAEGNTFSIGKPVTNNGTALVANKGTNIKTVMTTVVERSKRIGIIEKDVVIGYGNTDEAKKANLRFDPQYMIAVSPTVTSQNYPPSPGNSPPLGTGTKKK